MSIIKAQEKKPIGLRANKFKQILAFYLLYVFVGGIFLFALPHRPMSEEVSPLNMQDFSSFESGLDRVILIDEGEQSIAFRLDLIRQAEGTLELAYHSLHKGVVADVFYGALLEAADRGVEVKIIMDGIFHRLYGSMRGLRYALEAHPNIEFRLYEPFHLYKPWRWNNRLHDKIMVVDGEIALISGRNIGNRYYLAEDLTKEFVLDLDVVVFTKDGQNPHSAVHQMNEYFNLLWNHPFTQNMRFKLTSRRQAKGEKLSESLVTAVTTIRSDYSVGFSDLQTLQERCIPVERIKLIHNPISRGKKEPWVWASLVHLAHEAKDSIVVQSPYIIPTKGMLGYLKAESLAGKEVTLLTNSLASSPNLFGVAGYKGKRNFLGNWATEIWEYYGPGSLHGKAVLFDDNLSAVGSFNMDARSSFLSTETMLIIEGNEFNQYLRSILNKHAEYSQPILSSKQSPPAPLHKRIIAGTVRVFSWFVDYLL